MCYNQKEILNKVAFKTLQLVIDVKKWDSIITCDVDNKITSFFFFFLQYMEVHGVCTCQDRRAESEGSESEAAGHLRLHFPPAVMWRPAAQTPDPAQITHRVSNTRFYPVQTGCVGRCCSDCPFIWVWQGVGSRDGLQRCFHLIHSKTSGKPARMLVSREL